MQILYVRNSLTFASFRAYSNFYRLSRLIESNRWFCPRLTVRGDNDVIVVTLHGVTMQQVPHGTLQQSRAGSSYKKVLHKSC